MHLGARGAEGLADRIEDRAAIPLGDGRRFEPRGRLGHPPQLGIRPRLPGPGRRRRPGPIGGSGRTPLDPWRHGLGPEAAERRRGHGGRGPVPGAGESVAQAADDQAPH